jgi:hypothetical protein
LRCYERRHPGELVHIDVKKLDRIKGGAGKRVGGGVRLHNFARVTDAARPPPAHGRLGVRARLRRRSRKTSIAGGAGAVSGARRHQKGLNMPLRTLSAPGANVSMNWGQIFGESRRPSLTPT